MIPDSRLPPRHLHAVHLAKTFAVLKWESPYDSPDKDMVRSVWGWLGTVFAQSGGKCISLLVALERGEVVGGAVVLIHPQMEPFASNPET